MKKIVTLIIMFLLLLAVLTACGNNNSTESSRKQNHSSTTSSRNQKAEELEAAENEFSYAVDRFSKAQSSLRTYISDAEALLDTITEANVDDPAVLGNLRKSLDKAKDVVETTIPEIGNGADEIRQQTQGIREQADMLQSLCYEIENVVSQVRESHAKYEESARINRLGIVVMKANFGSRYTYNSTGTFKFVPFTVTLDIINPETGEVSALKTFSSEETHSCSAGFYGGLFGTYSISSNTTATKRYFNSDFTKMVATLTLEDGSVHIGWIDENGRFTDVSGKISASNDFGGLIDHQYPRFWSDYLYFEDFTSETVQIKRVPLNNLTPDAVEILIEDVKWKGVYPNVDGSIRDSDSALCEYYNESMTYAANTNDFNDWISESEYVGTDKGMIYKYNLAGEPAKTYEWYSEKTALVPEVKGRENWNAVVSPECNKVAFLSKLTSGTKQETMLYIVPIEGGDPIKVNTTYDFSNPSTSQYERWVALMDWR